MFYKLMIDSFSHKLEGSSNPKRVLSVCMLNMSTQMWQGFQLSIFIMLYTLTQGKWLKEQDDRKFDDKGI